MKYKKQKEILSYIWSLKERAQKLREEANNWEVKPKISKRIRSVDGNSRSLQIIIKIASKLELNEREKKQKREKKQLMRLTKSRLSSLKRHFLSVYKIIQKNPSRIWDKRIKITEGELEERIAIYEKILPLIFREKSKKPKKK